RTRALDDGRPDRPGHDALRPPADDRDLLRTAGPDGNPAPPVAPVCGAGHEGCHAMSLLEFRGVGKSFGGLRAIDNVSFTVGEGEIAGLIGPNGAGKTTLFAMASGFLAPTDGQILFRGQRIEGSDPPRIC